MWAPHVIPFLLLPLPSSLSFLFPVQLPLPPSSSCIMAVLVTASSVGMVLRCRSHIVAAESSPPPAESNHLRTAKSPRNGLRTSEKETTPAVLALTAMAMVEAVASEKLGGAGSRRRRRTTAARADTAAPSPSFHADLGGWTVSIFLLKLRFGRGRYRRGPGCDDSGKSNPVHGGALGQAAASGPKWFSAASWIGGEAGSSEARRSGINRCGAAGVRRRAWAERKENEGS
uniref:Uncharacterized protein n=1 Tax=Oryza sativa subsp. japonica TaxID=39947 RepID=Q10L86_ORYSJ|nr:hypothetical protein LOC_Os03g24090 [Oryza sativa Japonica Group]